ncbi:transporter substrate-binding domain-containing protein [Benzoatithermus flavus]|uniref:Transporter substrate-binding domain-containing protein n=1 Tax=Benzoatithermus flavus TaxID=3108223 RepID=A0ABU8XX45_9PROT
MTAPDVIRIGLLFSTSGPYATIGRAMMNGACLALAEITADPAFPFRLEPLAIDPGGRNAAYAEAARAMLADAGLAHVVGCYTSSSRKEVLPLFEKHDALLWYPSHYEGFESSENVVYTGAAPNQHIVPLVEHLLRTRGRRAWCLGSNYIWAWENNRIMREAVLGAGGTILAERYFAVGETDLDAVIAQILEARPDFVFNTLIGTSAYAFFRRFRAAAAACGIDQASAIPVASCSLAEPELIEIGPEACAGHISSSVYFESIDNPVNRAFVAAYRAAFPDAGPTSADVESSYLAVHLLARAIRCAGRADIDAVRAALPEIAMMAPQGEVRIDPDNRHSYLTPRIGISNAAGGFDVIYEAKRPVKPDPYLVWHDMRPAMRPRSLRLVR